MNPLSTYFRLLKSIRPYWFLFAAGIVATIGASGIDAVLVWAVKPIIDTGLIAQNKIFLKWLPIFIILIFIMRGLVNLTSMYSISRVGCSIVMDFRQQVFAHMLKLPAQFYDQESSGKLLSLLLYNISQISSAATNNLVTMLREGSLAIGMVVVMFTISWHLTLFFIVFAPFVSCIIHIMTKRQRKLSFSVQDSMGDVTHIARESIEGYKIIRTFNGEEYEREKFNNATLKNRHRELKVVITNALGTSAVQIVIAIPMALLIYIVGMSHLGVSVGGFGAMIAAVLRLLTPLRRLTRISTTIQKGIAGSASVFEMLDTPIEKDTGIKPLTRAEGKIEYRNVTFNYTTASNIIVLQNISFTVKPGQIVALVGHSGAGKSTLVNLLPRFYDVEQGEILIDDVNIKDYHLTDLRKQFSFVSQHITLFNDTIGRNIAYGRIFDANEEEIFAAAKAAYILDFIRELPDGINTLIGENGLMLSGGQRQRIAIARAILKNAPILILDEATSSLDTESEQYLKAALEKLMSKRTTLVIAHRLSTVEKADRILVLDHGKIIEDGTHSQLIAADTYYSKLYKLQFNE